MNDTIITEPTNIRQAIEGAKTVTSQADLIDQLDRKAKGHLDKRDAAKTELQRLKQEWVNLLEKYEILKGAADLARGAFEYGQKQADFRKEHYFGWVIGTNTQFLEGAEKVAALAAALPILKERVTVKENILEQHKQKVLAFGREHGIDEKDLTRLS